MINLILIDTGYPRYIGRFHIKMQAPVTQEEIDRKQDLSNTLRNISDIMNTLNTENINFFENYKINVYIRKKLLYNYYILIIK